MKDIRVAILGPTGYTGLWLIKILARHPYAQITYLASRRDDPPRIEEEFPQLIGVCEMACAPIDVQAIAEAADVAFCALPHQAAMNYVPDLLEAGLKVVDLSADYRLRDADLYEDVYQVEHVDRENLEHAVYGLPELYREQIVEASLIANPGCYPTAAALSITPLLERSLVKANDIIINATSGVSGAGKSPKPHLHFPEVNEGFMPYAAGDHRHQPEIEQTLSAARGAPVSALFVPHLLPVERGILESIYLRPVDDGVTEDDLYEAFDDAYADEPFVRVISHLPNIKYIRDTNFVDISPRLVGEGDQRRVIVFSAEDNMVKGASGQAVQNMNILFGVDETAGLL